MLVLIVINPLGHGKQHWRVNRAPRTPIAVFLVPRVGLILGTFYTALFGVSHPGLNTEGDAL